MDPAIQAAYDAERALGSKPFRSACYAPFASATFDALGQVRVCCFNHEYTLGRIPQQRLDEIWQGPKASRLREALRRYDFGLGCRACQWRIASSVQSGLPVNASNSPPLRYDELPIETADDAIWPTQLEFQLSNRCNLECLICDGDFSSLIRERREQRPKLPSAYDGQFFEDLRKYLPRLREVIFKGGEPFLVAEHFRVWDLLDELGLAPRCYVTTNGTVYNRNVARVLDHFPVFVTVSIDATEAALFESQRVHAKFDQVLRKLRVFRDYTHRALTGLAFSLTLSRLNWNQLVPMLAFSDDWGADLYVNLLYGPKALSLLTLSVDELARLVGDIERSMTGRRISNPRNQSALDAALAELRQAISARSRQASGPPLPAQAGDRTDKSLAGELEYGKHAQVAMFTWDLSAAYPIDLHRDRMIDAVDDACVQPIDPAAVHLQTERLRTWSDPAFGVGTASIDSEDRIAAIDEPFGRITGLTGDCLGLVTAAIEPMLITNLGTPSSLTTNLLPDGTMEQTRDYDHPAGNRIQTRMVLIPRRNEAGILASVEVLAARRDVLVEDPASHG